LSTIGVKWGDVEEFYKFAQMNMERTWNWLKDKDFTAYRDNEFEYNLKEFYEAFKSIINKSYEIHHSFRFVKTVTDRCYELFMKEIQVNLPEFLSEKLPEKTVVFRYIIRGYSMCLSIITQEEEKYYLMLMLERFNFEGPRKVSDDIISAVINFAIKVILRHVRERRITLYELFRDTYQIILNNLKRIFAIIKEHMTDETILFKSIGDQKLEDQMDLLKSFVMVCSFTEFKKYISMTNKHSKGDYKYELETPVMTLPKIDG